MNSKNALTNIEMQDHMDDLTAANAKARDLAALMAMGMSCAANYNMDVQPAQLQAFAHAIELMLAEASNTAN